VDDTRLLDRARRGDEAAFSQLFERYQRAIARYAAYVCGRDACDDVVQETFLAVLRQRGRHDDVRGTVMSYLLGIARHIAIKRLPAAALAEDDLTHEPSTADQMSALDGLTRAETIATVRDAVQLLPERYREVIVLCELEELDYSAAAGVMQCPVGTVRSRLHRARALLTDKLAAARGLTDRVKV
jgi:RNA polymerase sigma-70 factor, ECF subfamily